MIYIKNVILKMIMILVKDILENDDKYVSLYAKDSGKANTENKYELPPPLDNELYLENDANNA